MLEDFRPDPETYRRVSEPHASMSAANEMVAKFGEMVSEARRACRMREVLVVVAGSAISDEGQEGEFITSFSFGRSSETAMLAAHALGEARAREEQRILAALRKR